MPSIHAFLASDPRVSTQSRSTARRVLEAVGVDPAAPDAAWLAAFEQLAAGRDWSSSTRAHYERVVRMYLRWRANPVVVKHEPPPAPPSVETVSPQTPYERAVLVLAEHGVTPDEVHRLSDRLLTVRGSGGRRFRYLPLTDELGAAVATVRPDLAVDGR